jgi:hypothetical protein
MSRKFTAAAAALAVAATAAVPTMASASTTRVCRGGDPPITVSASTSCAFAANVVDHAYQGRLYQNARIYSPVTHRNYWVLSRMVWHSGNDATVTAFGQNGIWMRFELVV